MLTHLVNQSSESYYCGLLNFSVVDHVNGGDAQFCTSSGNLNKQMPFWLSAASTITTSVVIHLVFPPTLPQAAKPAALHARLLAVVTALSAAHASFDDIFGAPGMFITDMIMTPFSIFMVVLFVLGLTFNIECLPVAQCTLKWAANSNFETAKFASGAVYIAYLVFFFTPSCDYLRWSRGAAQLANVAPAILMFSYMDDKEKDRSRGRGDREQEESDRTEWDEVIENRIGKLSPSLAAKHRPGETIGAFVWRLLDLDGWPFREDLTTNDLAKPWMCVGAIYIPALAFVSCLVIFRGAVIFFPLTFVFCFFMILLGRKIEYEPPIMVRVLASGISLRPPAQGAYGHMMTGKDLEEELQSDYNKLSDEEKLGQYRKQSINLKLMVVPTIVFFQFIGEATVRYETGQTWWTAIYDTWAERTLAVFWQSNCDSGWKVLSVLFQFI